MANPTGQVATGAAQRAGSRARAGTVSGLAALALALAFGAHPACAEDTVRGARPASTAGPLGPIDVVSRAVSRAAALGQPEPAGAAEMAQRKAAVREMAEELFDFDEVARRVLAQHWKDRSPQERAEFVRLFIDLLEGAYMTSIGGYRLTTVTFQGEIIKGPYARVRSRIITDKGAAVSVEYRLASARERWAVYDVEMDGVSLVSNYRSQLNSILRTSTFAELLEKLRGRQASVMPRQGP